MSQIPAGKTWFETLKKSFADVPVTNQAIETSSFLEAAEATTTLFGTISPRLREALKPNLYRHSGLGSLHPCQERYARKHQESTR